MLKRLSEKLEKLRPPATQAAAPQQDGEQDVSLFGEAGSSTARTSSGSIVSAETMAAASAAASAAATGVYGLMKKAQSAATYAAKEGSAKAVVWKNKALDAADMDALQRKLASALENYPGGPHNVDINTLNFTYVTDNVIAMGFPAKTQSRGPIRENPIDVIANVLNTRHKGHYMIWNLSEETYDYNYFDNQVLEFYFPGHPAPPLGLLFKICSSIESWTSADDKNIAVIHCLTGKGRTGTVIACFLAWIGKYESPMEALDYVSEARRTSVEKLTIPSQRRYIQYFTNVMDGVKPRSMPLLLRRVIINSIPVFGSRTTIEDDEAGTEVTEEGCCPYVQIFKGGKLVFTTTWRDAQEGSGVRWASTSDGSVSFNVDCMLQGDVLIRCRHLTDSGQRISMFRAAFHTGYIPMGILRLTKAQLDGACQDPRFDKDFFVDLIFAPVQDSPETAADEPKSEGVTISQEDREAYDVMLSKDEKFWDEIAARKQRLRQAAPAPKKPTSTFSIVSGDEDIHVEMETLHRKGSWDDAKDQDLLAELAIVAPSQPRSLNADFEEMKALEKELGLGPVSPTSSVDASVKSTTVEPPSASSSVIASMDVNDLLHDDFSDLGLSPPKTTSVLSAASASEFDFEDDEFAELEQYLSTLGPKGDAK